MGAGRYFAGVKAPVQKRPPHRKSRCEPSARRKTPGGSHREAHAFLGRFVQMRRENGRILHKSAACFCTLCLVVTNVRGNTPYFPSHLPSSPARGTWIEILVWQPHDYAYSVVPRKGDVDRNKVAMLRNRDKQQSSPARGTWIEMSTIIHLITS